MLAINKLQLRAAKPDDALAVVPLIYSSGPAEFDYGFAGGGKTAQSFLAYAFKTGKGLFSYQNHQVVLIDNELVGIGAFYSDTEYARRSQELLWQMLRFYPVSSWVNLIRRALRLQTIIPPLIHNTYYLADLAVKASHQGQGVGKVLLEFGKQTAIYRNIPSYVLDVSATNPRAQALYERFGFSVIREYPFKHKRGGLAGSRRMLMSLTPEQPRS